MTELQALVTHWLASLAGWLPLGYSFGAGMVASVNPCGFAMLPAYLSLFVGGHDGGGGPGFGTRPATSRLLRALAVGGAATFGFVVLFGAAGVVVALGGRMLVAVMPWVGVLMGVALVALGIRLLASRHLSVSLPGAAAVARAAGRFDAHVQAGLAARYATPAGTSAARGAALVFLFGVGYGLASLSCTLPVFFIVVGSALAAGGPVEGLVQFLSYALGMGFVVTALSLSAAVFGGLLASGVRRALPYADRLTAGLLLAAGLYILYYWLVWGRLL